MNALEERKEIEKQILHKIIRRKSTFVFELSKTNSGRILSFSPYEASNKTNLKISKYLRYKYSHLSRQIHNFDDARSDIISEIDKIVPVSFKQYVHLYLNDFLESDEAIYRHCTEYGFHFPSKEKINQLRKLIRKWKNESQTQHYQMTKQEKRKLKKVKKKRKLTEKLYYDFLSRQ